MAHAAPTLGTIAAEAGVSRMTVSRALRNAPDVSAATCRRVQRIAATRGYIPDPEIARLMNHLRTKRPVRFQASICGISDYPTRLLRRSAGLNYGARLLRGIHDRATSLGYTFDLINLEEYTNAAHTQRVLASRGFAGLVILPLRQIRDLSQHIDFSLYSAVSATSASITPQLHSVMPHHFDNMIKACNALAAAGFRRIGLALSREWDERVNHRWAGAMLWNHRFGAAHSVAPLLDPAPGLNLDASAVSSWLRRERPDVIVAESMDMEALRAIVHATVKKSRPPIVTMNWPKAFAEAGVDQRPENIGAAAIEILSGLIARGEKGAPAFPYRTMIDGAWNAATLRAP